jgi:hypothetical protein
MVVDLAVDSQHDVAARAHQRLVAALWVHDAEPLVGKHCCLGEVHARPVWPAVALALRQLDYCFPHLGWLSWFKPQQRQDAAHCCGVVLWCCGVVVLWWPKKSRKGFVAFSANFVASMWLTMHLRVCFGLKFQTILPVISSPKHPMKTLCLLS